MDAGCPFITCAIKRKGIEFCWQCEESSACEKWRAHREYSREHDTFVCYQRLEDNIAFIQRHGIRAFEKTQKDRVRLLLEMLRDFNEGRSKNYFCIAATLLEIEELETALARAGKDSDVLDIKSKSKILHTILSGIAENNSYHLSLRK